MKKKLFIFSNESIYLQEDKFFCDNIDIKTTPEGLNKKFEVNLFGRKSSLKRAHEIKIKKTKIIKEYSEDLKNRQRKCISKFKIKTDSWKTLTGEYIYGTNISEDEACFQARKTAVQTYLRNNFEKLVTNVQVINCSDVVEKKKAIAMNVPENITFPDEELSNNPKKKSNFISKVWRSLPQRDKDDIITSIVMFAFGI